nr:AAA domain-containing protein [Gordonia soli]
MPADADHRDRVLRLLEFLRGLVRSRSSVVRRIEDHPDHLWVGAGTGVSVRSAAGPGQVVVELPADHPDHADLAAIVDDLGENPETLELVLASGLVTVSEAEADDSPLVHEHIVTQAVVAERDADTGTITVRLGADSVPTVDDTHLLAGVSGVDISEATKSRRALTRVSSPVATDVAGALDDWFDAIEVDADTLEASVETRSALVLRTRGVASALAFYDAIIADLRDESRPVPTGLAQLVAPIDVTDRITSLSAAGALPADELVGDALYPLPANVEQRDVLAQLGVDSGVVVEGPPGTGKTHTIANLVAALLAKGQRVLVVSEKVHALGVLRDMLPTELRDLAVSIADIGRDDAAAVIAGVEAIATRKSAHQPRVVAAEIDNLTARRDQVARRRGEVLRELWRIREAETEVHEWVAGDYRGTPAQIVRACNADAERYSWLPGPVDGAFPPLDSDEFGQLVELYRMTGGARDRLGQRLPDLGELMPDSVTMDRICNRIAARPHEPMVGSGSLLSILAGVGTDRLGRIKVVCDELAPLTAEISAFPPTVVDMADRLLAGQADHLWSRVRTAAPVIAEAAHRDRDLGAHAVIADGARPGDAALFDAAADHLDDGGRWRGRLRRSPQQRAVEESGISVTVDGREPSDARSLRLVADHLAVLEAVHSVQRVLADLHVPVDTSGSRSAQLNHLVRLDDQLSRVSDLLHGRDRLVAELEAISPGGPRPRSVADLATVAQQAGAIAATNDAASAERELAEIAHRVSVEVDQGPSPEGDALMEALGAADGAAVAAARREWSTARRELDEQNALDLLVLRLRAKAPTLATQLAESAADPEWDARAHALADAWAWRRALTWAQDRSDPDLEARLQQDLDDAEADLAQLTTRLAATHAWRACLERMTVEQVQALQSYRDHMINLGKGSGKHANRFRAAAREAMSQARSAVPAWIMSISQVADTVAPVQNSFDVVIVDEASQADITSSFLLWLAPRVIVVGDDRQCAPGALVGTSLDEAFARLDTQLPDVPVYLRDNLTPRSSLFSLLRSRFGHLIRLREHFRSMPEIIGFSSRQFYGADPLIPVRQYGSDRLRPLASIRVADGIAQGQGAALVNPAEAQAVVDAVVAVIGDPAHDGLDIGIIVLQGEKQIDEIDRRLREALGADEVRTRRIRIGSPPDFQGDERHIVFVSMVVSDADAIAPLTRAESQRRVNVAASRAMDQLWLVHSIDADALRASDLRRSLLTYVQAGEAPPPDPMPTDVSETQRQSPFESLFEQRVFRRLADRGYHVSPQVSVNNRTIDLVVTGADARMAVECDGDEFRTTGEQARSDMERERELRRCGWEFWRVRESEFELDPDRALVGLWDALERRGVRPGSLAGADDSEATAATAPWAPIDLSSGD